MENAISIQVSVHDWLNLPMPVRIKLREIFGIKKSQGSLVEGNVVKSDGSTYQDLQAITVEKMQQYLGSTNNEFIQLFNDCVDQIKQEILNETPVVEKVDPSQIILEEWASRISHMVLQAGNLGLTDALKTLINKLLPYEPKKQPGRPPKAK